MATSTLPDPESQSATLTRTASGRCRFCDSPLEHTFINLGKSPLCESFLAADQLNLMGLFCVLPIILFIHKNADRSAMALTVCCMQLASEIVGPARCGLRVKKA